MARLTDPSLEYKSPGLYAGEKRSPFTLKALGEPGRFDGYASIFGVVDLSNDIIEKGAFARTLHHKGGKVPLLWHHDQSEPVGFIGLEEDSVGLVAKGQLVMGASRARDAYELMKSEVLSGLSVGFRTVKDEFDRASGVRHVKEADLWEVSLVTFPCNVGARVHSVKSAFFPLPIAGASHPWDPAGARARIEEKQGDLEVKGAHADSDCSYLIADVVDGKLTIIPKAVHAAAARVMLGAGLDLDRDQVDSMKHCLGRHYRRMDRTPPWESQKSLKALVEHVADLAPHMPEDLLAALPLSQKSESNPSEEQPFDWLTKEQEPEPSKLLDMFSWMNP